LQAAFFYFIFQTCIKMLRKIRIFIFILSAVSALQCYAQQPQRIVSLTPSITKMLYLLDAQKGLVGCTSYCEDAKKDHITIVASAVEVNVEKLFLLKPDLVFASELTKPSTIDALRKLGLKVNVFSTPSSFNELCSQFIEIAKLTGKQTLANNIIEKQKLRLSQLKQLIPADKKPKVFFEIGAKPLFTVIPNTFMDDYISFIGGVNIASDLKSGSITRESVLIRNPDVILIITMGVVGAEEKDEWENYQNIGASKNKKIFVIDSDKACSPTPINFVDVVEELLKLMYK
jgi:ABC-type Fe3+-hydroxamate transport system substrate-binding protein